MDVGLTRKGHHKFEEIEGGPLPTSWDDVRGFKSDRFDGEAAFQKGIRDTGWFKEFVSEYGEEPDLDTKDYDYRKAWAAGIRPERDPYDNNRYHWRSSLESGEMLKSKDHPTAWKEHYMREFGVNPDTNGVTEAQWNQYAARLHHSTVQKTPSLYDRAADFAKDVLRKLGVSSGL